MNQPNYGVTRRELMTSAIVTCGTVSIGGFKSKEIQAMESQIHDEVVTGGNPIEFPSVIDTNVSLFQWPFRRLPLDETEHLVKKLASLGVKRALAGSFEGILHRDISAANQRLFDECQKYPILSPMGSINPLLPGWREDLKTCCKQKKSCGIRLFPNYHGYGLEHPHVAELLKRSAEAGALVQIVWEMEDPRTQHPLVDVPRVDLSPLKELLTEENSPTVQILNARLRPPELSQFNACKTMFFDTSRVDGTNGIAEMCESISIKQICYGSHAPFLIPEAAYFRVWENHLADDQRIQVFNQNANGMIKGFA